MPLTQAFNADIFMLDKGLMTTIGWRMSGALVTKAIALELLEAIVHALETSGINAMINIDHNSDYTQKRLRGDHSTATHNPLTNCLAMQFVISIEVSNAEALFDNNIPLGLGEVIRKTGVVDADKLVNDEIRKQLRKAINDVAAKELSKAMREQGHKNVVRVFCDGVMTEAENQR